MFFSFLKQMKLLLLLATTLSSISAFLSLSMFIMIGKIGREGGEFNSLFFAGALASLLIVSLISARFLSKLSSGVVYNVRLSLIKRVMSTDYAALTKVGSEKVYNVLINDVKIIANSVSELPSFIYNIILLVSLLSYLAYLSPPLFAVLISGIFLSGLLSGFLIRRLAFFGRLMRGNEDGLMESYKGLLDGFAQMKFSQNRRQHHYNNELSKNAQTLKASEQQFRFNWDLNRSVTAALILMLIGTVIGVGQWMGLQAVLLSYILVISYSASPFAAIMGLVQQLAQANVSMARINTLNIAEQLSDQQLFEQAAAPKWKSIRFENVQFDYPAQGSEKPFHLGPLNVEIKRGNTLFITGGNGSGKSTFITMLLGLTRPTSGQIYVDGAPLLNEDVNDYRELFTTVLSHFYLYKNVLNEEGEPQTREQLAVLLAKFEMQQKVTFDHERIVSTELSQGQKKRLALITSIAQNKDIFVLDEWAADQDPQFRAFFYQDIIPWLKSKGKTVIAVTHDDRYFQLCDECIKFDSGLICEQSETGQLETSKVNQATTTAV